MPSGTLRLGFGSNHSSLCRAVRIAVSPTNQVLRSGCRKTADGVTCRPSTMKVVVPRGVGHGGHGVRGAEVNSQDPIT